MNIYKFRNVWAFIALAVVWGSSFIVIKDGLNSLPPVLFAALRYDIAGLVVLAYAAHAVERWMPRTRDEWRLIGVGGTLMIGVHFALLFSGQQYVSSAIGAIVLSTTPVVTPVARARRRVAEKCSLRIENSSSINILKYYSTLSNKSVRCGIDQPGWAQTGTGYRKRGGGRHVRVWP